MVDRRKAFISLISSWDHYQRSSPLQISDTLQAGFEPGQNLSSGFVEWSGAVVITSTLQCNNHYTTAISQRIEALGKNMDLHSSTYEDFISLGDFNAGMNIQL